jgi:hypothetical protein
VRLTTHLQLVPKSRKYGFIHTLPIRLHGVVLISLRLSLCLIKFHAMKMCGKSEVLSPRILNPGTRWRRVVSFKSRSLFHLRKGPWCSWNTSLGGYQSESRQFEEEKHLLLLPGISIPQLFRSYPIHIWNVYLLNL